MGLLKGFKFGSTSVTQGVVLTAGGLIPTDPGSPVGGTVTTALDAVTAPVQSAAINCVGYNGILVHCVVNAWTSGSATAVVRGSLDGVLYSSMKGFTSNSVTAFQVPFATAAWDSILAEFPGIPSFVKIDLAGTFVATLSVYVQPVIL